MVDDDVSAITATLVAYATAIDTKDWALFRTLFSADCEFKVFSRRFRGLDLPYEVQHRLGVASTELGLRKDGAESHRQSEATRRVLPSDQRNRKFRCRTSQRPDSRRRSSS